MLSINNIKQRDSRVAPRSTVGINPTARARCETRARYEGRTRYENRTRSERKTSRGVDPHGPSLEATRATRNRGFTLVELMVVITVIVILVALLGATLSHMGQQAKEAATNATIKKLHVLLEQRTEAFARAMDKVERDANDDPAYRAAVARVQARLQPQNLYAQGKPLQILVRKELKRSNFPQTFVDAGIAAPAGHTAVTESSEMLYRMLTQGEVGGAPAVDAGEFLASEVGDTDGDGLIEFIDAWGNPLRFYRWPTRLFKNDGINHVEATDHPNINLLIQGTSDSQVETDPDDPIELLASIINQLPATSATSPPEPDSFEALYHAPYTYHLPLIVSAGPDGLLGLSEPTDSTNFGTWAQVAAGQFDALTDNITNRNQRSGD